ncbi:MAG: DUF1707 SHOCT-like domain-containing protein [Micromonosporaceae bacterium]
MADEASRAGGDEVAPRGDLRASYDDRERVVDVLRVAAGDGRLTPEELDDRVGAALTARTHGELAALISDLPATPGSLAGPPEVKPRDMVRIDCHSGTARREGPWLVPQRMQVRVTSGSVTLDFTEAVVSWPSLQIEVDIRSGSLTLVTKPGILVNTDDLAIRSSSVAVRAPWGPDMPARLRIDVSGTANRSSITARPPRPPRRTFWQWLRRRPIPHALPPGRT